MEDGRFDEMARVLGGPTSRRHGLAAMLGSLVGLAGATAEAKGRAGDARRGGGGRELDATARSSGASIQGADSARECTVDFKPCTNNLQCCSLKCVKLRKKKVCINPRSDR